MALRLRRGTDAERQLITPAEGELVYTTDTKSVYIGDGATVGGIIISGEIGLGDLAEVDLSTLPTVGQVLKWDGTRFVPSDDAEGNGTGDGVVEGSNYRINIVGDDSSLIIDTTTNTVTGTFVGDGSQLTNLPSSVGTSIFDLNDVFAVAPPDRDDVLIFDGLNFVPQKIRTIEGADSTIMLDTATNTFNGIFVGDGSGLDISIFDLSDVALFTPPDENDILTFDGFNFVPQKIRIIEGADSTIVVDAINNVFRGELIGDVTGNLNGSVFGDVVGSVFGDDSTILVDAVNNIISGTVIGNVVGTLDGDVTGSVFTDSSQLIIDGIFGDIYPREIRTNTFLKIAANTPNEIGFVQMESQDEFTSLSLIRKSDSDLTGLNNRYGQLRFGREDVNGLTLTTIMSANEDFVWLFNGSDGVISEAKVLTNANGDIGIGTTAPAEKLDVRGNTVVSGFVQFGSLTTTERNTLTAANGMVIYNSTVNRFQGYQNGAWINLDDGTAA